MEGGSREYKQYTQEEINKRDINIEALSTGNLTWDKRSAVNKMARMLAQESYESSGIYTFAKAYNKIKEEMLYQHKIHINTRMTHFKRKNPEKKVTMYDVLNESEMSLLVKVTISLCNKYQLNIDDLLVED